MFRLWWWCLHLRSCVGHMSLYRWACILYMPWSISIWVRACDNFLQNVWCPLRPKSQQSWYMIRMKAKEEEKSYMAYFMKRRIRRRESISVSGPAFGKRARERYCCWSEKISVNIKDGSKWTEIISWTRLERHPAFSLYIYTYTYIFVKLKRQRQSCKSFSCFRFLSMWISFFYATTYDVFNLTLH